MILITENDSNLVYKLFEKSPVKNNKNIKKHTIEADASEYPKT